MSVPTKAPPPAPPRQQPLRNGAVTSPIDRRAFAVATGVKIAPSRVVVYGPGGVGKTELCSLFTQSALFIDLEDGSKFLDVARVEPSPESWDDLRSVLQNHDLWSPYNAVVIDSLTKAEELAVAWTLANVPHEKGHRVDSIEGYGFGKGTTHVYETFLQLLGDLDAHVRRGRHVVCVAHECTANVPNPSGEDWIRYEPRLQSPTSGKSSIRHRVKEWCDHLLYVGFDTAVSKDGKAVGSGTRTIYTSELPTFWAKSRRLAEPVVYEKGDAEIWRQLLAK